MKGTPVYVVRSVKEKEREVLERFLINHRILWQQGADGLFTYRHYGILLSDGSMVHFTGTVDTIDLHAKIRRTSQEFFCQKGTLCLAKDVQCCFPSQIIAQRALSQVESCFGGYHFLRNNCEHFTNWCANGKKISKQVMLRERERL